MGRLNVFMMITMDTIEALGTEGIAKENTQVSNLKGNRLLDSESNTKIWAGGPVEFHYTYTILTEVDSKATGLPLMDTSFTL